MKDFEYTSKESRVIRGAWLGILDLADCFTTSGTRRLEAGLRYERKHRRSVTLAQALMVRGWYEASTDHFSEGGGLLWHVSEGIAVARMFGEYCRSPYFSRCDADLEALEQAQRLCAEANATHARVVDRYRSAHWPKDAQGASVKPTA